MPKKQAGENSKKVAGNAKVDIKSTLSKRLAANPPSKKAESANAKTAAENAKKSAVEDQDWSKGVKSNAKKEEAEQKKLEAARRKAEKDALLAEEEKELRATPKSSKAAPKKTRGLDLAQLDDPSSSSSSSKPAALNASGIDNAIDALSLASANPSEKIDRHPERRFKAAYAAFEARRLPEVEEEHKGLRKNQRIELIRKEFEKHPDNPFNQANARFDSTKDEIADIKEKERAKVEQRLAEK